MNLKATGLCLVGVMVATSASASGASQNTSTKKRSRPSAGQLLTAATNAIQNASYRGVLINSQAGHMNTLRVFHRRKDGQEQQRLVAMNGPAREIISKGSKLISILPGKKLVLISQQHRNGMLNKLTQSAIKRIHVSYTLSRDGHDRIAGRHCVLISINPKDKFRYGYRLSIDSKTDLPLKLELVRHNRVLERLLFTQIHFEKSMPNHLFESQYNVKGYRVVKHQAVEKTGRAGHDATKIRWTASQLPPGFKREETGVRQVAKKAKVRQILFSDGLASVSAFIAPAGLRTPLKGGSSLGPVNAFGRQEGQKQITVVGEVPKVTVKLIAEHLKPKSSK